MTKPTEQQSCLGLCGVCFTSSFAPCPPNFEGGIQLPSGEWVVCQLCAANNKVIALEREIDILRDGIWEYQHDADWTVYVDRLCNLFGHTSDCAHMKSRDNNCDCGGVK